MKLGPGNLIIMI